MTKETEPVDDLTAHPDGASPASIPPPTSPDTAPRHTPTSTALIRYLPVVRKEHCWASCGQQKPTTPSDSSHWIPPKNPQHASGPTGSRTASVKDSARCRSCAGGAEQLKTLSAGRCPQQPGNGSQSPWTCCAPSPACSNRGTPTGAALALPARIPAAVSTALILHRTRRPRGSASSTPTLNAPGGRSRNKPSKQCRRALSAKPAATR